MAMKKKKTELKDIINSDRLLLSSDTSEMICYDLKNVLLEYFNLEGGVSIVVEPTKDSYEITVKATAVAVKSFGIIR
jgi:hypothetical protein